MTDESDEEQLFPFNPDDDFTGVFNYRDFALVPPITKAILNGDIESIKRLIQSGKCVNNADNMGGNMPLHVALMFHKPLILDIILEQPDINLNCQNHNGDTPLIISLKNHQTDTCIMLLLEAGCDVNIGNNMEEVPLHLAVERTSPLIAYELIKRGANVNAQDGNNYTPLHHAVESNNLETVCMLLCNSADVSLASIYNLTPFMYAVNDIDKLDVARVLFDYYVDFSNIAVDGYNALLLAANSLNPIVADLLRVGADVNGLTPNGDSILLFTLYYQTADIFKLIWPLLDHYYLLHCDMPFLFAVFNICRFPTPEWLECLYLVLDSPKILELIEHCVNHVRPYRRTGFFKTVMHCLYRRQICQSDRLGIIYHFLSFGAEVFISDINFVNELYGFDEEIKAFIEFGSINKILNKYDDCNFPLPTFIFAQEENYSPELIVKLFVNQFTHYCSALDTPSSERDIINALGFFSLSYATRKKITSSMFLCSNVKTSIQEKFKVIPEVPSLIELSRNIIRQSIKQNDSIKKACHFHKVVNNLCLPQKIKNIILFKEPLYK